MQETELRLGDIFMLLLRKWRAVLCVALIAAVIFGAGSVALRWFTLQDPDQLELLQAEYEIAYNKYQNSIESVERQIRSNTSYLSQAKEKLEDLARKKENYQLDIEDLQANIDSYQLQINNMTENIASLKSEKQQAEYQLNYYNEQNANSLFMKIDPYDVKTSEIFIRVDSGYQIIQDATNQYLSPTEEIIQTYCLLATNAAFYESMIADLAIDTEVRYLTELITVEKYNGSSLRICVVGLEEELVRNIAEYVCDAIVENHASVQSSVVAHTLDIYSRRTYSVVNIDLYELQQQHLLNSRNLETTIRELDATILNIEASIRQANADIRSFEDQIEEVKLNIYNIPILEEELENSIVTYSNTISQLNLKKLDLMNSDAPSKPGMTVVSALIRFVEFGIIGGLLGAVFAVVWLITVAISRHKVMSAKVVATALNTGYLGTWPAAQSSKKQTILSRCARVIDSWVERIADNGKADANFVCANIATAIGQGTVLLCGTARQEKITQIAEEIQKQYPTTKVIAAGSIAEDPNAITGLSNCDAVVLVEELYVSNMGTLEQAWERSSALNKEILGIVLA